MKFLIPVICLLTCLSLVFGAAGEKSSPPAEYDLSLLAVNVRKADALLLRSGVDAYLIDTGTEESFPALYETLKSEGVTRLTGVIVTHTHDDHAGGLAQLLESDIAVENLYASGMLVTINTDNMTLARVTLDDEYDHCLQEMGFEYNDLIIMNMNSVRASFMKEEEKKVLLEKLNACLKEEA